MEIRQASVDDAEGIRRVATDSLSASYDFIEDDDIAAAVDSWYEVDDLQETIADGDPVYVVAAEGVEEDSDEVIGFSESVVVGEEETVGEIRWLHVHPDHREAGVAANLLDHTEDLLRGYGAERLRGVVLEGHEEGTAFYEAHGFESAGSRELEVGGETRRERFYETGGTGPAARAGRAGEYRETDDGQRMWVDFEDPHRGSQSPFYPVYRTEESEDLYGWFCGNCDSFGVSMDAMERMECSGCTNSRKPGRWDSAYL